MKLYALEKLSKELLNQDILFQDVYHYTDSLQKLIGILERRQLIMRMHARRSNDIDAEVGDDYEISHSLSILRSSSIWIRKFKWPAQKLPNLKTFGDFFEYCIRNLRFFTCSFSLSGDDEHLWKMPHLLGTQRFSIRIAKEYFKIKKYKWDRKKPFNGIMKASYIQEDLQRFIKHINQELSFLTVQTSPKQYWKGVCQICSTIIPLLPQFIHEYYRNENEYRLYTQDIGDEAKDRISDEIIQIDQNGYLFLYTDIIEPCHIKEIFIWGSKTNFLDTKDEVKKILHKYFPAENAKNIEIKQSEVDDECDINN